MLRSGLMVGFILFIWFVISFVTNIIGPLMPSIIDTYDLNLTLAAFLPFSFFLAYAIVSIPSGLMIESIGAKKAMLIAFSLNLSGALIFAMFPVYLVALGSLFVIGMGMAMLQVIINPLMRTAGGEENFAFFSVMAQLMFGLASFVSPLVFTYLIVALQGFSIADSSWILAVLHAVTPEDKHWVSLYWVFAAVFVLVIAAVFRVNIPVVELRPDEKNRGWEVFQELLKNRAVIMFFLGIVAYVGTEQGLANFMSEFLNRYHGVNPEREGAKVVGQFWGLMSIGCLVGLALLKLMDSKIVLRLFSVSALIGVGCALFGSLEVALIAFPLTGFCISVMFSIIFSLGLNSVREHHGSFSGILCTGIFGGALVPLLIGILGDWFGLRAGMCLLFLSISYILGIGFWAKPLIANKTVFSSKDPVDVSVATS
jgi:fucose permease